MAFAPIALTIPQYDKTTLANWWLKAYDQGTTTPLSMATDSTGGTLLVKVELDSEGFPITAGSARFIPFINGDYDLWCFPTAAEADANDTTNAIQFADDLNSDPNASISVVAGSYTVADKAAAVLLTPVSGKSLAVESSDGGFFVAKTGAAPGTYSDDSSAYCGTVFIPTGGDGSIAWQREDADPVDASWFNVDLTGASSASAALQEFVDAVAAKFDAMVGTGISSASMVSGFVRRGRCLMTATVSIPSYVVINCDSTIFEDPTFLVTMFDVVGYKNQFNGAIFDGGLYQMRVVGPNTDTMQFSMDFCEYRNPGTVSIFHDVSVNHGGGSGSPRNNFSLEQRVTNFKTYTDPLIHAACNKVTLSQGWAQFRPYLVGSKTGDQFWCETNGAPVHAEDVLGVSVHDGGATDLSFWFGIGGDDEGELFVDNCRFGEGGSAFCKSIKGKTISLKDSAFFGRSGNVYAWLEIYTQVPSVEVYNCQGWTDSLGVLIDSATIASLDAALLTLGTNDLHWNLDALVDSGRAADIAHTTRATYKTNGLSQPTVTEKLLPYKSRDPYGASIIQDNLFCNGYYHMGQGGWTNLGNVNTVAGANDTTTGYTLGTRDSVADGAQYGQALLMSTGTTAVPAAGVYTFAVKVKTDKAIKMDLRYNNTPFVFNKIDANDTYTEFSGVFMHDGSDRQVGYFITQIENTTNFSVAFMHLVRDFHVGEYLIPGNATSSFIPQTHYGTAAPVAGTYKVGDKLINTTPSVDGNNMVLDHWVCTVAGTPGTWVAQHISTVTPAT